MRIKATVKNIERLTRELQFYGFNVEFKREALKPSTGSWYSGKSPNRSFNGTVGTSSQLLPIILEMFDTEGIDLPTYDLDVEGKPADSTIWY